MHLLGKLYFSKRFCIFYTHVCFCISLKHFSLSYKIIKDPMMFANFGCGCLQRIKHCSKTVSSLGYIINQPKRSVKFSSFLVAKNEVKQREKPSSNIFLKQRPLCNPISNYSIKIPDIPRRLYSKPVKEVS